ncbi:insulinase family protein, partial [Staphylococcus aureus]|nr:insulinase family protein [Staphylococcus aureus]
MSRAKKQLIFSLVSASESSAGVLENITYQAATTGQVIPFEKLISAVEAVTIEDVKKAASKVAGSKLSLAGYGNVAT